MRVDDLRTTAIGFGSVIIIFAALFAFVGVDELIATVRTANPQYIVLVVGVTLMWLFSWSVSLHTVLQTLDVHLSYIGSFFVFAGAMFSNNVTPFGQAGGEPITAYLISKTADAEYETSLAAIASVDTLNLIPSISIALIGVGYFMTEIALGSRSNIVIGVTSVVILTSIILTIGYTAWRYRYNIEHRVVNAFTPIIHWFANVVPPLPDTNKTEVESRIEGFFRAIERVAANPRQLAVALSASTIGWICQMTALWLAFRAIGIELRTTFILIIVPIATIAGVTPLPGGAGGIETVLVFLLLSAPLPSVTEAIAVTAVVIFRGAIYWVPVILGGGVVAWISSGANIGSHS
ncbi:lysylphosphatidylglycerol synthase transmembrane domain-containing protein [Haloquadratum walsbyi]|jgi:conserved hypothetical protein|uniref:Integral membrane protein n=1 Tax=Haloquadratum walsbyi J07HQW2 TaxID=1238425 RepID=U1MZZ8_9EURY|nr:lysylphosphatidylglycerol synthase transmembrane domain-containing protein [Haloquadratum walsbyi]ERG96104.1 MAG: hypothetical protein J07HQW2_02573 [Haloquadratum walsbyi J07HQW2]